MPEQFPKGSEWRRWDLQTQTLLDDGYLTLAAYAEELKAAEPKKWQDYVAKVGGEANALLYDSKEYFNNNSTPKKERCQNYSRNLLAFLEVFNPGLKCIGITDHNYWDDELLDVLVSYSAKANCKIIPGVEINCGGVHTLVFFGSPPYKQPNYSAGIKMFLSDSEIKNPKTGGTLTVSAKGLKEIIDDVNKQNGLVIFPHCNSDNGLFQERTKTDRTFLAELFNHQRMNLLQAQNLESAVELAEYIKKNANLVSEFSYHISSDARALKDIGRADSHGNYLWIKADPTFEGLKQIIYEPERIFVGPERPERKKSYFLIDHVRFIDNTSNLRFSSEVIEINQNLTTIIGGKSTGKSLLLYYIAKTIDPSEVARRLSIGALAEYDFDEDPQFNFEVVWADGHKNLLRSPEGPADAESVERKILYVPQKYLNTLSEKRFESREALNRFVLDVILQDEAVREQYEAAESEIKNSARQIPSKVADLFLEADDIKRSEEELKQLGDEKGIRNYIKPLQQEVDDIKSKSGFDKAESEKYENLTAREKEIATALSGLNHDKKTVGNLQTELVNELKLLTEAVEHFEEFLHDEDIRKVYSGKLKIIDSFEPSVRSSITEVTKAIDVKVQTLNDELTKIKGDLTPLLAKVKLQAELKTKSDAIKAEEKKLNEIGIKKAALKTKKAAYEKKIKQALDAYRELVGLYDNLRNEFKKFENRFGQIALRVLVGFKSESFNNEVVAGYINRKDLKRNISESDWGAEYVYVYDPTKHLANIDLVFKGLLDGSIAGVKNRSAHDAATKLLDDYFHLDFQIFYKSDAFDKMSPGKKGLVLLQVLVNLSDEEWPILLDQPEDDLDNRSVYEDLVRFLKEKKTKRQIIIVTHNPNLVVGADAEETVVANQSGQEINRENKKFKFEYVSGSLENSFELEPGKETAILLQKGIRQHVCEILEGGKEAFLKREQKYDFPASQRRQ